MINVISREKLNSALNLMKSEYNENKIKMQNLEEKKKQLDVNLQINGASRKILQSRLSSYKFFDRLFYLQIGAFALAIATIFLGGPIAVPIIVGTLTILESISYKKRFKKIDNTKKFITFLDKAISSEEKRKNIVEKDLAYYKEKDYALLKKIECIQNFVFDHNHSEDYDLHEIFEHTSKIEQQFQKNVENYR